jgi:hypothetical protein
MAGVGLGSAIKFGELRVNPIRDLGELLRGRAGHSFWRHFAGAEAGYNLFPNVTIVNERGSIVIFRKHQAAAFRLLVMADGAVFLHERRHSLREGVRGRALGGREGQGQQDERRCGSQKSL